jgi:hypothetical protein
LVLCQFLIEGVIQIRARIADLSLFPPEETYPAVTAPAIQYLSAEEGEHFQGLIVLDHFRHRGFLEISHSGYPRLPQASASRRSGS